MIQNGYTYYQYATILVVKIIIESNEFHALKYMLNLSIRLGCKTYKQGHCYTGFKVYDQHMSSILKYFTDRSKAVLLLWIFYVFVLSCVCYVFVSVCLNVFCGHLLRKG